jgi:hypothetical protein
MRIRELIQQLLNENLDSEIAIQCSAPYYEDAMPVDGILNHSKSPNIVMHHMQRATEKLYAHENPDT